MAITHVVRGDDHISNTPKQVLLYQAFGSAAAAVRARAADPGAGQEAPEQAARRDVGDGVPAARVPAGSDGEFPRRCSAGRPATIASCSRATSWSPRSRSRGSAAATRSSTPRSSTGSTSSTSCGCRSRSSPTRVEPLLREAGLWRDAFATSEREWLLRVLELFRPRVRKLDQIRRRRRVRSWPGRCIRRRAPWRST